MAAAIAIMSSATAACASATTSKGVSYAADSMATGQKVSVESLRDKPAVLVSWATWCRECDKELTALQDFAGSDESKGLRIVAVNLDAADVQDEIDAKIQRHALSVELWRDRRNEYKRAFRALGVPTTVVLDAEGVVVGTFPGAVDFDDTAVAAALATARRSS